MLSSWSVFAVSRSFAASSSLPSSTSLAAPVLISSHLAQTAAPFSRASISASFFFARSVMSGMPKESAGLRAARAFA